MIGLFKLLNIHVISISGKPFGENTITDDYIESKRNEDDNSVEHLLSEKIFEMSIAPIGTGRTVIWKSAFICSLL